MRVPALSVHGEVPAPALLRWNVPDMTKTATITFLANISAGCNTNIKM